MISVFLISTGALLCYSAIDGLIPDTITFATRSATVKVYTLAGQPGAYWFHIVFEGFFGGLLLVAGVAWHQLTRIGRPASRARRKYR